MLHYTVSRVQWWEGWSGVETMAPGTKWWSCTVIRTIKPWLLGDHVSLPPTGWRDNQHWDTLPSIITSNILLVSRFMSCVLSDKYFFLLKTNVTQGLCRWSLSITKQCPGWSHVWLLWKGGCYSPSVLLMSTLTPILTPPITDSTSSPMALVREVSVCRYHHYHYTTVTG